ncbi:MAG: tRNA pseudouridine 55 synthase [Myxococcales bacterium]|nr:tRNA pseudouridine 55 synthase [Myxococcales bacterium]
MNGVLVLDKPPGLSSASAVDRIKHVLGIKRAGHGGTLDPIATGVLAVCLGEATKLASYLLADDKEYEAECELGVEMDTLDRTGVVTATRDPSGVTREQIIAALAKRTGDQDQVPPMYSALKRDGVRNYERARAGETFEREPRRVRIDRLELLEFRPPFVRIAIACSKGTYVRSIVGDLGTDLGVGANMTQLRRTRSGGFTIGQAQKIDAIDLGKLVPLSQATSLPIAVTPAALVAKIRSGVQLPLETFEIKASQFQIVDESGALLAIVHGEFGRIIYDRVFAA